MLVAVKDLEVSEKIVKKVILIEVITKAALDTERNRKSQRRLP